MTTRRPSAFYLAPAFTVALALTLTLTAAPSPASAQSACGAFYSVNSGDTLREIAVGCGVSIPAILALNPAVRDDEDLVVGDRLRIPDPAAEQPSAQEACGPTYTVRSGDGLAEIAQKCGLTVPLLVAANPPLPDPLGIHTGLEVRIPPLPRAVVEDSFRLAIAQAASDPATADTAAVDTAAAPPELTRVEGVLEEGEPCQRVRAADGTVTAIAGRVGTRFGSGDRVVLLGVPTDATTCGHAPTLELRILYRQN